MDSTPPRAFLDDDDVGFGKTPEPRRRRVEELERRGELLCREKGALVRKLDAETKRFDSTLKAKMTESEEMRAVLLKTQKELERCKAEVESMREELDMFAVVSQQKALLALAQEQLRVVELEHRLVQSEQQRVIRDHRIALLQTREAELVAVVEERDERITELEAFNSVNSSDKDELVTSAQTAAADLAKALKENASLSGQLEKLEASAANLKAKEKELAKAVGEKAKLATQVEKLEASVEGWKAKERDARVQLEGLTSNEKGKAGDSDKEVRNLKAQLRSAKADLETKEGECVDLQEELASLKEKSKEKEKDLKAKLKEAAEQSEQTAALQEQIGELKASTKKAVAEAERAKAALKDAAGSAAQEHTAAAKKKASPARSAKGGKERARKAPSVEPESEAETIPKKTKRVHESPAKVIKKLSKLSREIADESDGCDSPSPVKARKVSSTLSRPSIITARPLGESSILNKLVKSSTMSALATKRKSPGPEKAPMITVTPADDEGGPAQEDVNDKGQGQGEKKKKRKLLGTKAAFKWDPILESGSGVIPSTFSPMKPGTTGTIPRLGLTHSASARALSRI